MHLFLVCFSEAKDLPGFIRFLKPLRIFRFGVSKGFKGFFTMRARDEKSFIFRQGNKKDRQKQNEFSQSNRWFGEIADEY